MKLSEYNISSLIQKINGIEDTLNNATYDIVDTLVTTGIEQAKHFNSIAPKSGEKDNTIDGTRAKAVDGKSTGSVYMQGDSAVYDEFGTGEEGASDAHPLKWQTLSGPKLNPYNSGPTIQINPKNGRHYWYYKPMEGKPYYDFPKEAAGYTEGIPSGKQMYNTLKHLQGIKKEVAVKQLNKAIGEINKVINKFK